VKPRETRMESKDGGGTIERGKPELGFLNVKAGVEVTYKIKTRKRALVGSKSSGGKTGT